MLPPVPAASVTHAMQANQRQASAGQVAPDTATQTGSAADDMRPVVAGNTTSRELLDLSGQMRLSQSLSVFAETLGSLLKLPRREGEALADYSKRLAAAINALSASERTRLQAQLSEILQGATLRLLAELLKDPSGPAAARLAVQIEIAKYQEQFQERDLVARHVVSSYRQNNGNELPANTNTPPAPTPHGPTGDRVTDNAGATTATQDGTGAELPDAHRQDGALPAKAVTAAKPETSASPPATTSDSRISGRAANALQGTATALDQASEHKTGIDGEAAQTARLPASDRATAAKAAQPLMPESRPQPAGGDTAPPAGAQARDMPSGSRPEPRPAAIYDAAALARLAHGENGKTIATTTIARAIIDGFQADWIADLLAGETEARHARQPVPIQGNAISGHNGEEIDRSADDAWPVVRQTPASGRSGNDTPEPVIGPLPQGANPVSASAALAVLPDTAFEKALLGMTLLPRDVPAHPLVPDGGTPEFDDEQNHEIRRKSPVGDDGQPSRREHQGFHQPSGGEEQQPNGDEQPAEQILSGDEEAPSDMPDHVPAATGPKQAPRQHLSDHPAPGAEDLYRRLASLE